MKAMFVAPDLVVLAQMLSISTSKEELVGNVKDLLESDNYEDRIKAISENPANLRFGWVRFDKADENVDFFTSLLMLSANNNYSISNKDLLLTNKSAFVNINLLETFKKVSQDEENMPLSLSDKISKEKLTALSSDMFDTPQFVELYTSDDGPEMFMLSATFSSDTWEMLSTVGLVSRRSFALSTGNAKDKIPGFCVLFGLSMTTLMHIVANSDKMPDHIAADIDSLPKAKKTEEG